MAAISLAVNMYRADHNHWPPDLNSLVPNYLAFVPDDPFYAIPHPIGYVVLHGSRPLAFCDSNGVPSASPPPANHVSSGSMPPRDNGATSPTGGNPRPHDSYPRKLSTISQTSPTIIGNNISPIAAAIAQQTGSPTMAHAFLTQPSRSHRGNKHDCT